MSGFGRCGEWFAWQRHGEAGRPDLMTLAKGLTGAHLPLGAVVLSRRGRGAARARAAPDRPHLLRAPPVLRGGRSPPSRPTRTRASSSAPGRSAPRMLARLRAMQDRLPVIGDVRGGHGLFAVAGAGEGPRDARAVSAWPRRTRRSSASWPAAARRASPSPSAATSILLAPPLVIPEEDLARRPRAPGAPPRGPGVVMTLQADVLHDVRPARGDARPLRGGPRGRAAAASGRPTRCTSAGRDVAAARTYEKRSPVDERVRARPLPARATPPTRTARWPRRRRAFPGWRSTPPASALRLVRRVAALLEERVYTIGAALALEVGKNRMEALGETQETADFFSGYAAEFERNDGYDHALPDDPLAGLPLAQPDRPEALRRLGRDHALQLPPGPGRRARRGGARHRQHRRPQGRDRHALGRAPPRRLHPRRAASRPASSTT